MTASIARSISSSIQNNNEQCGAEVRLVSERRLPPPHPSPKKSCCRNDKWATLLLVSDEIMWLQSQWHSYFAQSKVILPSLAFYWVSRVFRVESNGPGQRDSIRHSRQSIARRIKISTVESRDFHLDVAVHQQRLLHCHRDATEPSFTTKTTRTAFPNMPTWDLDCRREHLAQPATSERYGVSCD